MWLLSVAAVRGVSDLRTSSKTLPPLAAFFRRLHLRGRRRGVYFEPFTSPRLQTPRNADSS